MAKRRSKKVSLTNGEMELLSFLWQQGELSLSEAHEKFSKPIGYTTMQTRLNRMVEKGHIHRSTGRPARYSAAVRPEDVSQSQLNVLLNRVTEGSVVPLVAQLVNGKSISADEIAEIKEIIEQAEQRVAEGRNS